MKRILLLLLSVCGIPALAQTPMDGLLMPAKNLCTGFMYQHDSWDTYWEGGLKRTNGNVGTWTGNTLMWYGVYGVTPKLNVMASVPYAANKLSGGTLIPMSGLQDVSVSGKYALLQANAGPGRFSVFAVASLSTPLSNYSPDFFPISLGTHTTNVGGRLTLNYMHKTGIFLNASGGYTWRSNTKLDRPEHFTNGINYTTNEVRMYNTLDYSIDLGYRRGPVMVSASYMQMNTLGGGDIRRQDMPFVSNRMNAQRIGATVMYYVPWPKNFAVRAMTAYTLNGRNVGQTTTLMAGVLYTIYFNKQNSTDESSN